MFKALLKIIVGGIVLVMSISYLASSRDRSGESSAHESNQPQSSQAAEELACVLPSKPTISAKIPDQQLLLAELKVIKEIQNLRNAKEAMYFYKMYEEELANFPGSLADFKSRFDAAKGWQLEPREKGRLLATHKENFDATCVNYTRALNNKYARLLKAQRYISR